MGAKSPITVINAEGDVLFGITVPDGQPVHKGKPINPRVIYHSALDRLTLVGCRRGLNGEQITIWDAAGGDVLRHIKPPPTDDDHAYREFFQRFGEGFWDVYITAEERYAAKGSHS